MPPKKKKEKKVEEAPVEETGLVLVFDDNCVNYLSVEYDTMDLEMLREVVPMLRQQLEKSMLDRNYVQLERVGIFFHGRYSISLCNSRTLFNNILILLTGKLENWN